VPKKSVFESETSDSFDFVANTLKENSETLELLLKELRSISDRMQEVCELSTYKRIEDKIGTLQNEIRSMSTTAPLRELARESPHPSNASATAPDKNSEQNLPPPPELANSHAVLRCKNWEDFVACASGAQLASFGYREADKVFEVDALKNGEVVVYVGPWPKFELLLKAWLGGRLKIAGEKIFEGSLTLP
jgi:hypothetical protein